MKALTVVIGNYNYARFLPEAIESALAQTQADLLVIDDGSVDESREIIERYHDRFGERVRPVYKANGGQCSVYNLGLALVQTEFVLFLDSDDVLYPGAIDEVLRAFASGDFVKVQFKLRVIDEDGTDTGALVPGATPPSDCATILRRGWLYPSPPASGNAYRVSALRSVFPIPLSAEQRKAADFFAIYGVALTGRICALDQPLGGYRVHRSVERKTAAGAVSLGIGNCENVRDVEQSFPWRWETLRHMTSTRLGEELPARFIDYSYEKNRLCAHLYEASTAKRWHWLLFRSRDYFRSLLGNPFWDARKKIGVMGLTLMCLVPSVRLNRFALRYIANPLFRRPTVAR
ncbi:glycosyl transferase family 2 [Paraburkholderia eburnea]|uniref:Glycosyl transferase family 2 n=1 Tax=Paraburkholderia eburnea TaxID=1189126 RepID=A0A2S4MMD3_9BURK|nr:glycosyltransferase family A protein [Paraburkholderia eburnea]POR55948.1 glycosyl transferase family 2 [Paraburkholderia eburnea]PRZ27075.1 glycosyl transferase family 2 [Paraburkholderia eburnea]